MKPLAALASALAAIILTSTLPAQTPVPILLNYQGRVVVGTVNFDGTGQFRFALVDPTAYWSNDGSITGPITPASTPTTPVPLTVTKGLYSVLFGDTSLGAAMTAIPASVFTNADVRLRVWFDDGTNGPQLLTPDQRIAPGAYLADGSVTSAKIAANAVGSSHIAAGAVGNTQLAAGAVQIGNIAIGAVGAAQIAPGAIGSNQLDATLGLWTTAGSNIFRSGGNVGIGTAAPGLPLQVNRNGATADVVWNAAYFESVKTSNMADGFGTGFRFRIQDDAAFENTIAEISAVRDGADNSGKIRLIPYSAGSQVTGVVIDHLGNVGIGTSTPTAKLDVAGNTHFSGDIVIGGRIVSPGDSWLFRESSGKTSVGLREGGDERTRILPNHPWA